MVKYYLKETFGEQYIITILKIWDSYKEINFDWPNKFVLKANHGSGMNIIVYDKKIYNIETIRNIAKKWVKLNMPLWVV